MAWEYLRGTYWAVPSAMAVAAVALFVGAIKMDETAAASVLEQRLWAYTGGADGARAVLSTIAASMITVAGVTFSITIVVLTLASQQFGPRLLRNFLRDMGNQVVLGTFVSTFIYCLLVLRTVRGGDDEPFVPHIAVTAGVALAVVSLGVLIFFIHHVATSIQVSRIIASVSKGLDGAIDRIFPQTIGEDAPDADEASLDHSGALDGARCAVRASRAGYVQAIDAGGLMEIACRRNVQVRVCARPGVFVRKGQPLMAVDGMPAGEAVEDARLRDLFIIGSERTGTQDVTFFVDQLVDLAVRALSPGTNDPGTARLCIDRLEDALCQLAGRRIPSPLRRDGSGRVRVVACPVTFAAVAERAFDEIAWYGRSSVSVTCRLLDAVRNVGSCVRRDADRQALLRLAAAIAAEPSAFPFQENDRERVARCHRAAVTALRGAAANDRAALSPSSTPARRRP